jgi:tetratricopeptide (TPR) repeat protein
MYPRPPLIIPHSLKLTLEATAEIRVDLSNGSTMKTVFPGRIHSMDDALVQELLEDLKDPDETVREQATQDLWRLWFQQKGIYGLELLRRSQTALEAGDYQRAKSILTDIVESHPDFAEAWNRRAVVHYIHGNYLASLADCQKTVALNPVHFGALHGMGLCYAALGNYRSAIQAFRRALEIQPHALLNQKLILECTARLE